MNVTHFYCSNKWEEKECVSPKIAVGTKGSAQTSSEVGGGKRMAVNKKMVISIQKSKIHNKNFFFFQISCQTTL